MKDFIGPYGRYPSGSAGAVLNALCTQEGLYSCTVDQYVVSDGKLLRRSNESEVIADFEWVGDDITFTWHVPKAA